MQKSKTAVWGGLTNAVKRREAKSKVEKPTRPFSNDLNQIPYDYTVEVRNRFKGLDLIDRVPGLRFMILHR